MKKTLFAVIIILAFVIFSCKNNKSESVLSSQKSTEHQTDSLGVKDSIFTCDTIDSSLQDVKNADRAITKFDIGGEFTIFNGKVKSMNLTCFLCDFVDGKLTWDEEHCVWSNYISFREDGSIKEHDFYKACGGYIDKNWIYDSIGNIKISITCPMSSDDTSLIKVHDYDEKSNLIKKTSYDFDSKELYGYSLYFYDESNNSRIEKEYDENGNIETKRHQIFDLNRNVISESNYRYANNKITLESHEVNSYEFDSHGNWIVKYNIYNDESYGIHFRKIEYYE